MNFKKISAAIAAMAMATTMSISALSASAADYDAPVDENPVITVENDVISYTKAEFCKSNGDAAPLDMGTACIDTVSTDADGFVTIDLKTGTVSVWDWNLMSVTIEGCNLRNGDTVGSSIYSNGQIEVDPDNITVVYNADGSVAYGYVDVSVTFGGDITTVIALTPMTNPMNMQLRLF